MSITKNTDYTTQALGRLLQQFKGLPRWEGLVTACMTEVQAVEDAMWDVFTKRLLQNSEATGDLLDKIGLIVGQPRFGFDDDQYRIFISARIATNRSNGRRETLISITSILTNAQVPILFRQLHRKSIEIEVYDVPADPYVMWKDFLNVAKAAGDNLRFFFTVQPLATTLIRESVSGGVTTTTTQQKGSVSGVYGGGYFAGVFGGFA